MFKKRGQVDCVVVDCDAMQEVLVVICKSPTEAKEVFYALITEARRLEVIEELGIKIHAHIPSKAAYGKARHDTRSRDYALGFSWYNRAKNKKAFAA